MANILDILTRAQALRQETALNSITPDRAGGIMYDTLILINQMQLEGGSLLISKVYSSVAAMEADTTPTSDLTGRALRPGQLAVIVPSSSTSSDMGSVYRYNEPGSWTLCGKIGGLPMDTVPTEGSSNGITSGAVYQLQQEVTTDVSQLRQKVDDLSTGKYYGYFAQEEDLPEAEVDGFAYVGEGPTYTIYNLRGGVWTSSDITVNQPPIGNDEDIDQNEDGKLQFANRVYNAQQPNGMGYKILRKDATFASQVTETNTIYEIRYPFVLSADFTMPANCTLVFLGGSIDGEFTLDLNNCQIEGTNEWAGKDLILSGKTPSPCLADWFIGDDSDKIERAISFFSVVGLSARTYTITRTINILHSCCVYGYGMPDFFGEYTSQASDLSQTLLVTTMESGTMFNIRGKVQSNNISAFGSFVFEGIGFNGNAKKCDALTFTAYAGPSRPVVIQKCTFKLCNKGISFDTTAYDSSTVGTGCGIIDIKNNVIAYCNYGIWGGGRYVIGATTIEDNVIEQNSVCGIMLNNSQSYSDVGATTIRIISNLLEGQTEAINMNCNGASVEIAYNGFELSTGQNVRVKQNSFASVSIIGNRMTSFNPVIFYLTNCCVYARENMRATAAYTNIRLAIDRCQMIESDIPIDSISGLCTANAKYLTRKAVLPLAKSNIAFDSYIAGNFRKLIADNNSYVSVSLGFVTFEANKNYVAYFQLRIPKEVVGSKTYLIISAMSFEAEIPPALYRDCDEIIVMIGKTFDTASAPGLKSTSLLIKNNASGTPWYMSDVAITDTTPDQVPAPIIGETKNVNQPTLTADDAGATYFDRTLNKQIVWDGTAWVNMDGSALV